MKISPARIAAFEILTKIETEKAFSSVLLPQYEQNLSPKDRALCHEITLGVLRRLIYLDRVIKKFTSGRKLDTKVKIALRIGLYQILFLDKIPAYSAINESVNLVQKAKKTSAKGFVNAVLRRATREKIEFEFTDEIEKLSVETSHPVWLLKKWIGQFGAEETRKLAFADNEISRIAFRPTVKTSPETFRFLEKYKKSEIIKECFIAEKFDGDLLKLAESGEIYIQDEASQMVGNSVELEENQKFLDVCAAPGSKTTLAHRKFKVQSSNYKAQNSDLSILNSPIIISGDFYWHRIKILQENLRRQGIENSNIVQCDAGRDLPFAVESFDAVLLDAPCSGTGTIRHNPEIRYFLRENDFAALSAKQLELLKNASYTVKSGGKLIYSTCSLEREENEEVIEMFLRNNSNFEKRKPLVPEKFMTAENFGRTFPQIHNSDGFFISELRRK